MLFIGFLIDCKLKIGDIFYKVILQQNLKSLTLISVPNTAYVNIVLLHIQIKSSYFRIHGKKCNNLHKFRLRTQEGFLYDAN